jgi:hypothetical protein
MSHFGDKLQRAIYAALTSHAPLTALVSNADETKRIYDRVPERPVFPYLTIGNEQAVYDGDACNQSRFEVFADIHTWTRGVGIAGAKAVSAHVCDAIAAGITVTGWNVAVVRHESERHFVESDGLTGHGVSSFKFIMEKD